jgi:pimeloyl-ACP methyl ester carboxylesterase
MTVFAFPGWGCSSEVFYNLKKYLHEECIVFPWESVLSENSQYEIIKQIDSGSIIIGWSIGGFGVLDMNLHKTAKHAVLISSGLSFSKSKVNPFGVPGHIIKKMQNEILETGKVNNDFFVNAVFPEEETEYFKQCFQNSRKDMLHKGLDFLQSYSYEFEVIQHKNNITIFQGKDDKIFHYGGAAKAAKVLNAAYQLIDNAGHFLPFTHCEVIAKYINSL